MAGLNTQRHSAKQLPRHYVRQTIQDAILNGKHLPGSKLVQLQLAKQFKVAQGVVREALLELQACGLVEIIDNRGVFVSELNTEKLIEAYEIREVHEGLAARRCSSLVTRDEIRGMLEISEQIYALGIEKKYDEMSSMDRKFHSELLRLSKNSTLMRMADNYRILGKIVRGFRDPRDVYEEHKAILRAIEDGRGGDAEHLMRQHISFAKENIMRKIADGEFTPHWVK